MQKAFKCRLSPTEGQAAKWQRTLDLCRTLYHAASEQRRTVYLSHKKSLSKNSQMAELPALKTQYPEFDEVYSRVLQDVLKRLDRAFAGFFRRLQENNGKAGYPRFKGKDRYDSFTYLQFSFSPNGDVLSLSKIGDVKSAQQNRPQDGGAT